MIKSNILPRTVPVWKVAAGLLQLTKPGIVVLSLVATFTGLILGAHGRPDSYIIFWTMLGMLLATAGGAALNNFIDRDIDSIMKRTQKRSIPSGLVSPDQAYLTGTLLVLVSLMIIKVQIGTLTTILTGCAVFGYVVVYSMYLKRRTPLATHIGGVAGALPPIIGYSASAGQLDLSALFIFLVIFVWQQPHFWSLALKYREDYRRAGIPILPVAKGVWATKVRLFWYTLALVAVSILPYTHGISGIYYIVTAITMGIAYLVFTVRFLISAKEKEMFLFFFSIVYLTVVFAAMVLDMT